MKAIDLYAAHALGALLGLRPDAPHPDDHKALVDEARDLAVALAKSICEVEPCDVTFSEDAHGNIHTSRCNRCGD